MRFLEERFDLITECLEVILPRDLAELNISTNCKSFHLDFFTDSNSVRKIIFT